MFIEVGFAVRQVFLKIKACEVKLGMARGLVDSVCSMDFFLLSTKCDHQALCHRCPHSLFYTN